MGGLSVVFGGGFLVSELRECDCDDCGGEACRIHRGLDREADKGEDREEEKEFERQSGEHQEPTLAFRQLSHREPQLQQPNEGNTDHSSQGVRVHLRSHRQVHEGALEQRHLRTHHQPGRGKGKVRTFPGHQGNQEEATPRHSQARGCQPGRRQVQRAVHSHSH